MRRASTPGPSSRDCADASTASSAVLNCFLQSALHEISSSSAYSHCRQFFSILGPFTGESLGVTGSMSTGETTTSIHGYAFSIPKIPLLPDPNPTFILKSLTPNDLEVSAIDNVDDVLLYSFNRMLCMIPKFDKILGSVVKFMPDVVNLSFLSYCYCHLTQAVSLLGKIPKMGCQH